MRLGIYTATAVVTFCLAVYRVSARGEEASESARRYTSRLLKLNFGVQACFANRYKFCGDKWLRWDQKG